mgnify:CR=1 FL=1
MTRRVSERRPILLAVDALDAAEYRRTHSGVDGALFVRMSRSLASLEGHRAESVHATPAARRHPAYGETIEILSSCVARHSKPRRRSIPVVSATP